MTDAEFLLHVLSDGLPHHRDEIVARSFAERGCGLTPHSRAPDLRKLGYDVRVEPIPGKARRQTEYQLVGGPLGVASGVNGGLLQADPPASGATPSGPAEFSELDGGAAPEQMTLQAPQFRRQEAA